MTFVGPWNIISKGRLVVVVHGVVVVHDVGGVEGAHVEKILSKLFNFRMKRNTSSLSLNDELGSLEMTFLLLLLLL
jgi:hypothetical protein